MIPITEDRIAEVTLAYAELKRRGWGFSSGGKEFGDPESDYTAVGPMDELGFIEVLGLDPDCVEAVRKAVQNVDH